MTWLTLAPAPQRRPSRNKTSQNMRWYKDTVGERYAKTRKRREEYRDYFRNALTGETSGDSTRNDSCSG